jgi:hypothetical protein
MGPGDRPAQAAPRAVDRQRVRGDAAAMQGLGDVVLRWQGEQRGKETRIRGIAQGAAERVEKARIGRRIVGERRGQAALGKRPRRLPAVERIAVMGQQEGRIGQRAGQDDRGGKPAVDRGDRPGAQTREGEALLGFGELDDPCFGQRGARSRPVASSNTLSQSSIVQACPSWRSK